MKYRVVIPCAGTGSRLCDDLNGLNKALVSVSNKPVICYIIEKFPANIEIVIALGYKKETLKEFLELAYPARTFLFIDVDNYERPGSGLGYSLLKCREHLQCPFVFCSNDTIVTENIPVPNQNWVGYSDVQDISQYRFLKLDKNDYVIKICPKGEARDVKAYIGLCGINDYKTFWDSMHEGSKTGSIENGESYALADLQPGSIKALKFEWYDVGNPNSLKTTREHFDQLYEAPNILEKKGEAIWFVDDKVVKYSTDTEFIKNRVKRANYLSDFVPEILSSSKNMYSYKKAEGEIFSKHPYVDKFEAFLMKMDEFWVMCTLNEAQRVDFKNTCLDFYKTKTFKRVEQFFARFQYTDREEIINGHSTPKLYDILNKVDWGYVSDGVAARFHGDLHFENILVTNNADKPFVLLDWRQDFGGNLEFGDIYYDLAKINHGLIVCHELVNRNLYEIKVDSAIDFDLLRKHNLVLCEERLKKYAIERGYDPQKIQIITALIFLNIAALHHYPYSSLLFYLGKSMLNEIVQ